MSIELSGMGDGAIVSHEMSRVPAFARPWLKLGRLKERERWHSMGLSLLEKSVERELSQMKDSCLQLIPTRSLDVRLPSFVRPGDQRIPAPPQPATQQQQQRAPIDRQESINIKPILISRLDTNSANILEIIAHFKQFFPSRNMD